MEVHRKLGPGLREDSYQRDLEVHLSEKHIPFEAQKLYEVFDTVRQDLLIGYYLPDFVIDNKIVVEIKALKGTDHSHLAQVIGYLAVTGCALGLLINFGEGSLVQRRIFPPKDVQQHRVNRQFLFVPDHFKAGE